MKESSKGWLDSGGLEPTLPFLMSGKKWRLNNLHSQKSRKGQARTFTREITHWIKCPLMPNHKHRFLLKNLLHTKETQAMAIGLLWFCPQKTSGGLLMRYFRFRKLRLNRNSCTKPILLTGKCQQPTTTVALIPDQILHFTSKRVFRRDKAVDLRRARKPRKELDRK